MLHRVHRPLRAREQRIRRAGIDRVGRAADAREDVAVAQRVLQAVRDFQQRAVARGVPVRVVDRLDAVEIDVRRRHRLTAASRCAA